MLGAVFGLSFAFVFGAGSVVSRRGVLRAGGSYIANISILTGPVFFLVVCVIIGEIFRMGQFPWISYVFFAISGVIHFAFGRTFSYKALELIGATRTNVVTNLSTIVTIILAVAFLRELFTPVIALGIALSLAAPILLGVKGQTAARTDQTGPSPKGKDVDRHSLYLGLLYGLGAAVFWGSSPLFVKMGIESGGSSIAGNLTAFTAASLAISPSFLSRNNRAELFAPDWKSLRLALMSGLSSNVAQMLRFLALAYGSVITVSMAQRTIPIWTLLLAFIFNRKLENFGFWVLLGNALLLIGTALVMVEQLTG